MTLKARLTEDMKTAMRAKDSATLSTIRLVNAAIKQFEVDERAEADDAKVVSILTKMVKQRKDSAQIYTDAGRQDLADKENAEIDVLNRYLPQMMSAAKIEAQVAAAIAALRQQGETVVCVLPGHESEVDEFHCDRELANVGGQWVVQAI